LNRPEAVRDSLANDFKSPEVVCNFLEIDCKRPEADFASIASGWKSLQADCKRPETAYGSVEAF
jgi:hypothetical protein